MEKKINKKFKIAFLGRGELGLIVLKKMITNSELNVCVIVSCKASPEVKYNEDDFKSLAERNKIPFYSYSNLDKDSLYEILNNYKLDLAVAMLWLFTLDSKVINTTKWGFINCHSGKLPKYRGNACGNWAILNNEKEFGITTHFMKGNSLDSGPIILQKTIPINQNTKIETLMKSFQKIGAKLVLESIDLIKNNELNPIQQNDMEASYCYPRIPSDGEINWLSNSEDILRLINASGSPYPGAYTYFIITKKDIEIKKMIIHDAYIENHPLNDYNSEKGHLIKLSKGDKWAVVCGDKKLLVLNLIEIDSIKYLPKNYFKSIRIRFGLKFSDLFNYIQSKSINRINEHDIIDSFLIDGVKKLENYESQLDKILIECSKAIKEKGIKNELNLLKNLSFQKKYFNWENRERWFGIQIYKSLKIKINSKEVFTIGLWFFGDKSKDLELRLYISINRNNSRILGELIQQSLKIEDYRIITHKSMEFDIIDSAFITLKSNNLGYAKNLLIQTANIMCKKLEQLKKP